MPRRLKLIIAYNGSPFGGWQSQKHRNTVQDQIELGFERVLGQRVRIHGAGRTDTGVHALAQCAHVDLPDARLAPERWMAALNALLPPTIRILRCRYVSRQFHARFSATGKVYRYRIWAASVLPPFEFKRAWHITAPLDLDRLRMATSKFRGTHDFAGFAANRGKPHRARPAEDTIRTIRSVRISHHGPCVGIEFDGHGFLYKMVRLMVGAVVECAAGKMSVNDITQQLECARRTSKRFAAPAEGLFLIRVRY